MPISATSHIQNTAPAPPMEMAIATPAMLPVPTRLASPVTNAWNDVIPCGSLGSWRLPEISFRLRPNRRNCTKPVVTLKNTPTPNSSHNSHAQSGSLTVFTAQCTAFTNPSCEKQAISLLYIKRP